EPQPRADPQPRLLRRVGEHHAAGRRDRRAGRLPAPPRQPLRRPPRPAGAGAALPAVQDAGAGGAARQRPRPGRGLAAGKDRGGFGVAAPHIPPPRGEGGRCEASTGGGVSGVNDRQPADAAAARDIPTRPLRGHPPLEGEGYKESRARYVRTCSRTSPWNDDPVGRHSAGAFGSASASAGNRATSPQIASRASSRASGAPMQIWAPAPKLMWGAMRRAVPKRCEYVAEAGSRLAATVIATARWGARAAELC